VSDNLFKSCHLCTEFNTQTTLINSKFSDCYQGSSYSSKLTFDNNTVECQYGIELSKNTQSRKIHQPTGTPSCFGLLSTNSKVCNGHGDCTSADTCSCSRHYAGTQCELPICFGKNSSSALVCASHGTCSSPNNCTCDTGYTGVNCHIPVCYGKQSTDKLTCNGNGRCVAKDTCKCYAGHYGVNCHLNSTSSVCGNTNGFDYCSNHGQCNLLNVCDCSTAYTGQNCSSYSCYGEDSLSTNVCSGRGVCTNPDTCSCDEGYTGGACNLLASLCITDIDCNNGTCSSTGECICSSGYRGYNCKIFDCFGIVKSDTNTCFGNGICIQPDVCECGELFEASNCSIAIDPNKLTVTDSEAIALAKRKSIAVYTLVAIFGFIIAVVGCCCFLLGVFCFFKLRNNGYTYLVTHDGIQIEMKIDRRRKKFNGVYPGYDNLFTDTSSDTSFLSDRADSSTSLLFQKIESRRLLDPDSPRKLTKQLTTPQLQYMMGVENIDTIEQKILLDLEEDDLDEVGERNPWENDLNRVILGGFGADVEVTESIELLFDEIDQYTEKTRASSIKKKARRLSSIHLDSDMIETVSDMLEKQYKEEKMTIPIDYDQYRAAIIIQSLFRGMMNRRLFAVLKEKEAQETDVTTSSDSDQTITPTLDNNEVEELGMTKAENIIDPSFTPGDDQNTKENAITEQNTTTLEQTEASDNFEASVCVTEGTESMETSGNSTDGKEELDNLVPKTVHTEEAPDMDNLVTIGGEDAQMESILESLTVTDDIQLQKKETEMEIQIDQTQTSLQSEVSDTPLTTVIEEKVTEPVIAEPKEIVSSSTVTTHDLKPEFTLTEVEIRDVLDEEEDLDDMEEDEQEQMSRIDQRLVALHIAATKIQSAYRNHRARKLSAVHQSGINRTELQFKYVSNYGSGLTMKDSIKLNDPAVYSISKNSPKKVMNQQQDKILGLRSSGVSAFHKAAKLAVVQQKAIANVKKNNEQTRRILSTAVMSEIAPPKKPAEIFRNAAFGIGTAHKIKQNIIKQSTGKEPLKFNVGQIERPEEDKQMYEDRPIVALPRYLDGLGFSMGYSIYKAKNKLLKKERMGQMKSYFEKKSGAFEE
jgi:hypothetical protein